jgi:hypothetical protein
LQSNSVINIKRTDENSNPFKINSSESVVRNRSYLELEKSISKNELTLIKTKSASSQNPLPTFTIKSQARDKNASAMLTSG